MSESREEILQTKVDHLRKLIRRINYESNQSYKELENENMRLRDELQQKQLAYTVLDQNCERFQQAINYWRKMYDEEDEEQQKQQKHKTNNKQSLLKNSVNTVVKVQN